MSKIESHHDAEAVREFFNQWALYRKIVDQNYLFHREAGEALRLFLDKRQIPPAFLDLGCGDARFTSDLLHGRALKSYTGMDLSPVALDLARTNLEAAGIRADLICDDFFVGVEKLEKSYDLIFIGLSLHHLQSKEKRAFLQDLRRRLSCGGVLLIFDPVRFTGESRNEYLHRWVEEARASWCSLSAQEVETAVGHVTTSDFPEEITTLNEMAVNAGFHAAEILFKDPSDFYALMAFSRK